ncbi:hypothetical protein E8E13_003531 [Curvularia kusanoi]|uniref:NadR/Ttd14 AAA domain-containing protein n=1 Tax=Curvularia kusanoi TaxID=90978 RepID=A0A9P4W7P3_CURKU|nr:hypothetical protein E8E13_003531 [Curvularia kusanoi]
MKAKTLKRVLEEVKAVNADFYNLRTVISEDAVENDFTNFYFVMLPNDGAMAHLSLVGTVGILESYPENPPIVKLYTPTKRYNVDVFRDALQGGQRSSMCFDVLRSESSGGSWKPEYTLSSLFASLMSAIVSFYVYQENGTSRPEYVSMERLASVKESAEQVLHQHKPHLPKTIPRIPLVRATRVPALPLFAPQTFIAGSPGVLTSEPIFLQTNLDTVHTFAVDLSSLYDDIIFSVVLSNSATDFLGRMPDTVLVRNGVTATAARKLAGQQIQWFYHGKPMNDGDMRLHVSVGRDQMTFAYYQDGEVEIILVDANRIYPQRVLALLFALLEKEVPYVQPDGKQLAINELSLEGFMGSDGVHLGEVNLQSAGEDEQTLSPYFTRLHCALTLIQLSLKIMRNIYVVGAQSTGKTTLVNALAAIFQHEAADHDRQPPSVIHEVVRKIIQREAQFSRKKVAATQESALRLQHRILAAQYDAEVTANEADTSLSTQTWYISDRSGLDPIVYARYLVGKQQAAEMLASPVWQELEGRIKAGLVILCEAGGWLEDDGLRLMPEGCKACLRVDAAFRDMLAARGIEYHVMSKHVLDVHQRADSVQRLFVGGQPAKQGFNEKSEENLLQPAAQGKQINENSRTPEVVQYWRHCANDYEQAQ